jgi:hypothetical protein
MSDAMSRFQLHSIDRLSAYLDKRADSVRDLLKDSIVEAASGNIQEAMVIMWDVNGHVSTRWTSNMSAESRMESLELLREEILMEDQGE